VTGILKNKKKSGLSFLSPAAWLIFIAFLVPMGEVQNCFGEAFSLTKMIMLIVLFLTLGYKAIRKEAFFYSPLDIPLLFFILFFLLSAARAKDMPTAFLVFATIVGYFCLNMVVFNFVLNNETINKIVAVLIFSIFLASIFGIIQYVTGLTFLSSIGREKLYFAGESLVLLGTERNPNAFSVNFAIGIPLIFSFLISAVRRFYKLVLFVVMLFFIVNLLWTLARGAMLGALAGAGVVAFLTMKKDKKKLGLTIITAVCVLIFINFWWRLYPQYSSKAFISTEGDYAIKDKSLSMEERMKLDIANLRIFLEHPLIGMGYDNSRYYVANYGVSEPISPHNIYLAIACELGMFGLLSFLAIIAITFNGTLKALAMSCDPLSNKLLIGLLGAYVSMLTIGLTHTNYVSLSFWLVTGLLLTGSEIVLKRHRINL